MGFMQQIASLYVKVTADISDFEKKLVSVESGLDKSAKKLGQAGSFLTRNITLPIIAAGTGILKMSSDFDQAMRNVNSILQASEEEFRNMYDSTLRFSMTTRASAVEVAEAYLQVSQAGFRGKEATELMEFASRSAGAAFTDAASMARLLIGSIRAYGLEASDAEHITDVFVHAMQSGAGSVTAIANSFARVAPSAAQAGVSLEETTAALTVLGRGGLSTAESTTALNNMMLKLIQPSKALTQVFNDAGYASATAAIQQLGLAGTMMLLKQETGGSVEAMAALFPRIRALRGALMLTAGEGNQLAIALADVKENADNAMERARIEQYKSLQSHFLILKGLVEVLAITIGSEFIPALAQAAQEIQKGIYWIENLNTANVVQWTKWLLAAAVLGPFLLLLQKLFTIGKIAYDGIKLVVGGLKLFFDSISATIGILKIFGATMAKYVIAEFASLEASILRGIKPIADIAPATATAISQMGAMAVTAGALALAIGAVTIAIIKFNERNEQVKAGVQEVQGVWGEFFSDLEAGGASAEEIGAEYASAIDRIKTNTEDMDWLARTWVRLAGGMEAELETVNAVLARTAETYEDYKKGAAAAGLAAKDILNKKQWSELASGVEAVSQELMTTEELMAKYGDTAGMTADEMLRLNDAIMSDDALQAVLEEQIKRLNAQLELTGTALEEAGWGAETMGNMMDRLAVSTGLSSNAANQMRDDAILMAHAFANGLITYEDYVQVLEDVKKSELTLADAERERYELQLEKIAAARQLTELESQRAKAFAGALGGDLAKLIEQHGQLVSWQASSVEETNSATIAALKAGVAYDKWQESIQKFNENTDDEKQRELNLAMLEAHNAYLKAAESAGMLNNELTTGGSYITDMSDEIRESLIQTMYDSAVAADAPITALIALAAATEEWSQADIEAALRAAALQEKVTELGKQIAEGTISVDTAITAIDQLWTDIQEMPAEKAFEVSVDIPQTMTVEEMEERLGFKDLIDTDFTPLEDNAVTTTGGVRAEITKTIEDVEREWNAYEWSMLGENARVTMADGYTETPEENTLETEIGTTITDIDTMWNDHRWDSLGIATADGIKKGWDAQWPNVKAHLVANVQSLENELRITLGVESPSKVTAYMGEMLAKGIGVGFERGIVGVGNNINTGTDSMVAGIMASRQERVTETMQAIDNSRKETHYHLNVEGHRPKERLLYDYSMMRSVG